MTELLLFTDGSVDTPSGIGYGAYLTVVDRNLSLDTHRRNVKVRRFESTSSTKLEIQTLLWAINEASNPGDKVFLHTDSQNIIGLLGRRDRLEKSDFRSRKGKRLNNHELYKAFYATIDQRDCVFAKIKGHKKFSSKNATDEIFTLVDKASRQALRKALNK